MAGVAHGVTVHLVALGVDLCLKNPLQALVLVILSGRTLGSAAVTGGTTPAVPPSPWDLILREKSTFHNGSF